ncbi:FAD-binding oxidoreductase [Hippea maritima]|uniref:D-lactate dehydrogenase (Cytochrome) n=1 Tax=Hippea maritima (strain ATCC 700847 / DSM 10411 / MH2) TaxID=760142 RepID=F2LWH4_HIPMA|nr:FAD-linked oxidase C-terminal domain-containing protein [Hippea maritima]AEA34083.1 D-lactate dehydrogenase (cytochrome) [Hippea maritima DSM 10411]
MKANALKKIKDIFKDRCLTDKLSRVQYSYDATQNMFLPDVVVLAENTREVSQLMKIANKYNIPVVPRGWGSGFTGGALNVKGGICLSLEKMDKVVELDLDNMMVWVEAGMVNYDLQEYVKPYGLFFPPDPSSWKFSTIGGNIAENAGGPKAVKYGVMKDWIKGLEIVLADGTIMQTGSKNIKDVAGYDLTSLLVGSEGTLAIITKALLKLYPLPEAKKTIQLAFDDMKKAAAMVNRILLSGVIPVAVEFVDKDAIQTVKNALNADLPRADAILIIEVDGSKSEVEQQTDKIKELSKKEPSIVSFKIAKTKQEEDEIWLARRSISPTLKQIADGKLNEDIVVPRSKLAEMIERLQKISKKYNLPIVNFGHAGDGNIHVNIMYHTDSKKETKNAFKAMNDVFDECIKLGGSITGEHGVGITKQDFLEKQIGKAQLELLKRIKQAFDPNNIINPAKMRL